MKSIRDITGFLGLLLTATAAHCQSEALTDAQNEFFESRIRPVIAQECYECHSEAGKQKGGLLLDSREGWKKGGESGPVIEPGNPDSSLLLRSLTHEIADLKMPKAGAKLDPQVIEDFRNWIAMGAPDPRDTSPSPEEVEKGTNWSAVSARRAQWWSFQPVKRPALPEVAGIEHPVDRFIRERLVIEGLNPSPRADPRVLVRRLFYHLIGLPPTPEETVAFLTAWEKDPDRATESLVDRLLADPGFGEKWARHWMDWTRYADTHGSEGDPVIPHSWRYRDYLVRAIHADVPVDQLLLEHFAGDLLEKPRINAELKLNESALGLGHLRMVFHGFSPTDALDERVRFTDDQINSATKAFLGLTVSCARCHDHKFDAISQADYYALFGIFTTSLPATIAVDAPGVLNTHQDDLTRLKWEIRRGLAEHWLASMPRDTPIWESHLAATKGDLIGAPALLRSLYEARESPEVFKRTWADAEARSAALKSDLDKLHTHSARRWDLSNPVDYATWSRYGEGLEATSPSLRGDFVLAPSGEKTDRVVASILPSGAFSHLLSTRHRAVLASAPFDLEDEFELFVRVAGEGSSFRYAVQHYPRSGTIYPVTNLEDGRWRWVRYDLAYWKGDRLHLEFATAGDAPILVKEGERSWFGLREAVLVPKGSSAPPDLSDESIGALLALAGAKAPSHFDEAAAIYTESLSKLLADWSSGEKLLTNAQAILLDELLAAGWLPNTLGTFPPDLADLVSRYRTLESGIPEPTRAPGVFERPGADQALFDLGDHKQPAELIPRRFLEIIDATPYDTGGTGRLEFARDLVAEKNPFTTRVLVNRVWHHLFGGGIVPTIDNFGRLGERPTHPELLDFLADRFRREQAWSLKDLVRDLVLSETWRQSGGPSSEALARDPDNRLLSSFPLRRLEAEAIRDSILALSGRLDRTLYGLPVGGGDPRRSIYVRVKRNDLDPFLSTFDFPVPASTVGRRDVTNVPAQSLTLLNDPTLSGRARQWSETLKTTPPAAATDETRIRRLFEMALTRPPTSRELTGAKDFLASLEYENRANADRFTAATAVLQGFVTSRDAILEPVRARLESKRAVAFEKKKGGPTPKAALDPIAHWDFENGTMDLVGGLELTLNGTARLEGGALLVDEKGFARSSRLPFELSEKSLEAVVELTTLDQAGGGVMSVQKDNGGIFDSIVFAERRKQEWLAGSNGFVRTLDFDGPPETRAAMEPVHLVITYRKDGTIRCFRNGTVWGEPIRKADLQTYLKGEGEILFGLRHGTAASGNKTLRGRILEARLYGRALDESEVHAASFGGPVPVTRKDIEAALDEAGRNEVTTLDTKITGLELEIGELHRLGSDIPLEDRRWADLAHAILNLKEFIYLR